MRAYDTSTRRFNLDLDEETFKRLNHFLRPGERAAVFRAIIDDLIDLMEKIGPGLIIAGITNRKLRICDYTRICTSLRQLFYEMDRIDRISGVNESELPSSKTIDNVSSLTRRDEDNNVLQGGEVQTDFPSEETFKEVIEEFTEEGIEDKEKY
jgi:hypothetical protein